MTGPMTGWQKAGIAAAFGAVVFITLAFLGLYFAAGLAVVRWLWS